MTNSLRFVALAALAFAAPAFSQTHPGKLPVSSPFVREFNQAAFIAGGQAVSVDHDALLTVPENGEAIIADFPLSGGLGTDLVVHRIHPAAPDAVYQVVGPKGRTTTMAAPEMHFFGGTILGDETSRVFLSVTPAGVFGYVYSSESKYILSSGPLDGTSVPVVCDMASEAFREIEFLPFDCQAVMAPDAAERGHGGNGNGNGNNSGGSSFLPNCRTVDIAIDTDQEFVGLFGGSTTATLGYIQTLVAASDDIYRRDSSVQQRIIFTRIWTTVDPWTGTDTPTQLNQMKSIWDGSMTGISRDVAVMVSGRGLGGGIAWLSSTCGAYAYAVCANMAGFFPTPTVNRNGQNWDIMVFTHELGHTAGAPHTHDHSPPIDNCAGGDCSVATTGTIMSYCHLCAGGMSNMNMLFHPISASEITNFMSTAPCAPSVVCSSNPACVLTISSAGGSYLANGGSATVNVTTVASGCAWTPVAVPSWITVTNPGPGSGNGTFAYTVQPNTTAFVRNFTMMFGDLTHTITQGSFGDCNSNGINDATEITNNPALDCDGDNILNSCEIASGAKDCDLNGVPDDCQVTAPVRGWGAGSPGSSGPPNYGQSVPPTNLGAVKALGAGSYHSLAVQLNGKVFAWGLNDFGQTTVPSTVTVATAVAGGGSHSMALLASGFVSCWGNNTDGQCTVPPSIQSVTAVAAGYAHSVALQANQIVVCWGNNAYGQCTVPTGLTGVTAIAAGTQSTIALRSTGTVSGWGRNDMGQAVPPAGLTGVTSIGAGGAHSAACRSDGTVTCWGNNTFGQCTVPADLGPVQKVFVGGYVTMALQQNGVVRIWGRNDFGQATVPTPALTNVRALAAGTYHTLAFTSTSQFGDCDNDGISDACEIRAGAADTNSNGIPDSCEAIPGDINHDGHVDGSDLAVLLGNWNSTSGTGDVNGDGRTDGTDLAILLGHWG